MQVSELKVGTRVRLVSEADNKAPIGLEGAVVATDRFCADVVWDGYSGGHSGNSSDQSENHWYLYDPDGPEDDQKWEVVKPLKKKAKKSIAKQIYKGNGKHDWEAVVSNEDEHVDRLRVPGGWLYRDVQITGTMTFVPIPEMVHPI